MLLRFVSGCPASSVPFIVIGPGPYCHPVPSPVELSPALMLPSANPARLIVAVSAPLPVCPRCDTLLRLRLSSPDLCCSQRFCSRFPFGCSVLQPSLLLPSTAGPTLNHGPARIHRLHQPRVRSLTQLKPQSHLTVTNGGDASSSPVATK